MADKALPHTELATSSEVLRDYIFSRLRSGARLTLSDKLVGLALLSRESVSVYGGGQLKNGGAALSPQLIGELKGYLLSSRTDSPEVFDAPDLPADYFNISCGRIAKIRA